MIGSRPEVRSSFLSFADATTLDVLFTPSFSTNVSLAFFQAHGAYVPKITMIAREKCNTKLVQPATAAGCIRSSFCG
ncbi:MAG: hypothetical protein Q8Q12_09650 [bacterium]|nr:hypothetical protein [bacterium]